MSKTVRNTAGLLFLVAVTFACQPDAPPGFTEADRAAIEAVTEAALAIANGSGDWIDYTNTYYAPDAVVMPPNAPTVRGREAITAFLRTFPPLRDVRYEISAIDGSGDIAYAQGNYSMLLIMPDQEEPVSDQGKYLEVWVRQPQGGWQVALDIFNSDLPLPPQGG